MKKEISEALLDFYEKMLAPEFSGIKKAQSEQEERFVSVLGHFDSVYKRFDRLEDEYYTITHGLKRIEEQVGRGC
jgi:predicted nuclease with TOPRIM domain